MSLKLNRFTRRASRIALAMVLLPCVLFYAMVFRNLVNLPFSDDYSNILEFLIAFKGKVGLGSKIAYLLTAQHNEYKLFFENSIIVTQYRVMGHANFTVLCIIGDLSILFLGIILWKMFLPALEVAELRLALFIPVSWMIFQLAYAETLNWAAPGIQNLYIPVFSLATFLFLAKDDRRSFLYALVCVVLSIATSGNGFIAALVGLFMLLRSGRFKRILPWVVVNAAMVALYAFHYNAMSSQSPQHHSIVDTLLHIKVVYVLSFLGSAGASLSIGSHWLIPISVLLGCLLLAFFPYWAVRGSISRNPAVEGAVAFLFITAVGVAGLRSDFGIEQSMSSRYKIYSSLLLAFVWFVLAERYCQRGKAPLLRNWLYVGAVVFSVTFGLKMDRGGSRYLSLRKSTMIEEMSMYEHPPANQSIIGPDELHIMSPSEAFNPLAGSVLRQSAQFDIYQPPDMPLLPVQ